MPEEPATSAATAPGVGWVRDAYERHAGALLRYGRSIVRDPELAQDLVHDVFVKLCQQEQSALDGHLDVWLFRVIRNQALDWLRRNGRMQTLSLDDHDRPILTRPEDSAEHQESLQHVLQQMGKLSAGHQEVLRLRFQNGLTYKQIAEITDRSVDHVGVLIHQAVRRLRDHFRPPNRTNAT